MTHRDLVSQSIEELRLKTAAHDRLWHLSEADWSVDQDTGEIVFSAPNGMVATCSVQIIGTFDTTDCTWLWAWDHPSVQPPLATHAERVRQYGETNGIPELTTRKISCTEEQCWEFTALACKLNEAQGGYRGPAGSALVFMTFGEPRLTGTGQQDASAGTVEPGDSAFTSDIPAAVRTRLGGFIKALHDWEVAAYQASERSDSAAAMNMAKDTYAALVREWCVPDLTPQPVSYGSDPSHGPETEQLVSAAITGDLCRVRTQHTGSTGFVSDYEYHLRLMDGEWLIEQLYYVDEDGKYEML